MQLGEDLDLIDFDTGATVRERGQGDTQLSSLTPCSRGSTIQRLLMKEQGLLDLSIEQ